MDHDDMRQYRNNLKADQDRGQWEPPTDDGLHEAIEQEFDLMIRDPGVIENAFCEGLLIDAIAAATWAQLADSNSPTWYECVAKRMEESLRRKMWELATKNVKERAEP